MLYGINDTPSTLKEWVVYSLQQVLSVFCATVLIAKICGTPTDLCLLGACIGTLIYQFVTKFKSPMFISSCGATAGAVIAALSLGGYQAVYWGGLFMFNIYAFVGLIVAWFGIDTLNKFLPPTLIGAITLVIGINLAGFIPTYLNTNGEITIYGTFVAIITMLLIGLCSTKGKGIIKNIPFLIGLLGGYFIAVVLTVTNIAPLVDFSVFKNIHILQLPHFIDLSFLKQAVDFQVFWQVAAIFIPVSLAGVCEHISDHKVLSNIVGVDLLEEPGLPRTLWADGFASFIGSALCGLPNTSYGESIATVGFSKVASTKVISLAALILGSLAFIGPVQAFILSIPSVCFAGAAMVLYGYIASSGLRTLINSNVDFNNNKNLILVSVVLTTGVSGMYFINDVFSGVSLALILGVILNLILKDENN